ncbi:unnamed protein product [Penicillium bialowiezense]
MDSSEPSSPLFGADAPHDQNWNPEKSKRRSATQASLLPHVKPPLDSFEGFGKWYQAVLSELEDRDLQDLIELEIPRPHRDDANAERWYHLSRRVLTFLTESVDSALTKRILKSESDCIFADEFMAALKNHMLSNGHSTAENSAFDLWEAKQSDYKTTKGFIRAMEMKLARVKPWDAYIVVSRELAQSPGLELAIHRHNSDPSKQHSPKHFKRADFEEFCQFIKHWVDQRLHEVYDSADEY